jgi:ankyrin repeat domain-containing protein 50
MMYGRYENDRKWKLSQEQSNRKSQNLQLLDRLSDFDYRSALKRLRKKRFQNPNGLWLARTTQYKDWLWKNRSSTFLLSGIMGSGKSVLSSAVIDDILLKQLPTGCFTAFFFCEHDNARSLTARTILGSLARQFIPPGDLPAVLETELHALLDGGEANGDELSSFFVAQSDIARTHIVVIDGLDECSEVERELILGTIKALLQLDKPVFKFFLCGRDDIITEVCEALRPEHRLTMSCKEVSDDIKAVIDAKLDEKQQKRKLVLQDNELLDHIKTALRSGAHGM